MLEYSRLRFVEKEGRFKYGSAAVLLLKLEKCPLNPENILIYTAVSLSYPTTISNYISLLHRLNGHLPISYCHLTKFMRNTFDIFHLFLMIIKRV